MDILTPLYKAKELGIDIGKRILFTSFDSEQRTPLTGEEARDKAEMFDFVHTYCRADLANILQAFTKVRSHKQALPIVIDIYQEGLLIQYIPANVVLDNAILNPSPAATEEVAAQANSKISSEEKKQSEQADKKDDTQISAISEEAKGVPVDTISQHPAAQSIFVPFRIQDAAIEERFYYLYYEALIRLGKTETVKPSKVTRHYFTVSKSEYVTPNMLRLHLTSDVPLPTDEAGFAYRFVLTTLNKKSDQQPSEHGLGI